MIKYIKISIIIIIIGISLFCSGCDNIKNVQLDNQYLEYISRQEILDRGFVKQLSEYNSDCTVCFEDREGLKTLFIFSSPIKYYNNRWVNIDSRIINSSKGYVYESLANDFCVYYRDTIDHGILLSGKQEYVYSAEETSVGVYKELTNFIGHITPMVVYDKAFGKETKLLTYPTNLGISTDIVVDSNYEFSKPITFRIDVPPDIELESASAGYIVGKQVGSGEIVSIIHTPIIKDDKNKQYSVNNSFYMEKTSTTRYELTLKLDQTFLDNQEVEFPITANICFELRKEKQPDTQIYSWKSTQNSYLSNYSIIGKNEFGIGKRYIRFSIPNSFNINSSSVVSANFYTYCLSPTNNTYQLKTLMEDWCSLTVNWDKKIEEGYVVSESETIKGGEIKFNITEEVKKWLLDDSDQLEQFGLGLEAKNISSNSIFLSNDNALYKTRTEITFR